MGWNTYYTLGGAVTQSSAESRRRLPAVERPARGRLPHRLDRRQLAASTPRNAAGRAGRRPGPSSRRHLRAGELAARARPAGRHLHRRRALQRGATAASRAAATTRRTRDQFAAWGFDAIKVDFLCGIAEDMDPGPAYRQFSAAVAASGRPMLLNLCNPLSSDWGEPNPYVRRRLSTTTPSADDRRVLAHRHRRRLG
jgi:alpha-galactosidase